MLVPTAAGLSLAVATVVHVPVAVRRWILATLPLWAGVTRPENLTLCPRAGVLSLTPSVTLTRTLTANSVLVTGGEVFADTRYLTLRVGLTVNE